MFYSHSADEGHHIDDFFNHPDIVNHPALPILARQGRDFISGRGKSFARQFLNRQDQGLSQMGVSVPKSNTKLIGILIYRFNFNSFYIHHFAPKFKHVILEDVVIMSLYGNKVDLTFKILQTTQHLKRFFACFWS